MGRGAGRGTGKCWLEELSSKVDLHFQAPQVFKPGSLESVNSAEAPRGLPCGHRIVPPSS